MTSLEEDMKDLHLSLDSTVKSPAQYSPRLENGLPQQLTQNNVIYLSRQQLKHIPNYVLISANLKNLYLEGNEMSSLPNNIFSKLPNLVWLDLRNNQLTCLPVEIGEHRCLKTLLLEGNPITELPGELGSVITLRALSLRNCPISFPPQDVLQQGLAHILHFLRRSAVSHRPLAAAHGPPTAPDMTAVEKLALSGAIQSSVDLGEEEEDEDGEVQRFKELRQRMIQMEKDDLGQGTPTVQPLHSHTAAEGSRSCRTYPLSPAKRTRETMTRTFPEVPLSDVQDRKRSERRNLAAVKEQKEKQALLEQRRKDKEMLQEWRNQARILQERKILKYKQDKGEGEQRNEHFRNIPYGADSSSSADLNAPLRSLVANKETEQARAERARDLERRIRNHIQEMQERRNRPRGSPAEEAQAALQELEEVKQLQLELAERRRQREREYRFTAFTGEGSAGFYDS